MTFTKSTSVSKLWSSGGTSMMTNKCKKAINLCDYESSLNMYLDHRGVLLFILARQHHAVFSWELIFWRVLMHQIQWIQILVELN